VCEDGELAGIRTRSATIRSASCRFQVWFGFLDQNPHNTMHIWTGGENPDAANPSATPEDRNKAANRDAKFSAAFDDVLRPAGVHCLTLPPRSPNLNSFAERWVRSVKEECLTKLILFGEESLHRALNEFTAHFHSERDHQGKGNVLLFPSPPTTTPRQNVRCRERLGGLPRYYSRAA
jgi:hypothetical protein